MAVAVGDSATSGSLRFTITEIDDPYTSPERYDEPLAGNRFVAFKILIVNEAHSSRSCFSVDFRIMDSAGVEDEYTSRVSWAEKALSGCPTLSPGGRYEGCIAFEIEGNRPMKRLVIEKDFEDEKAVTFAANN
jgi:hypothetical protein